MWGNRSDNEMWIASHVQKFQGWISLMYVRITEKVREQTRAEAL